MRCACSASCRQPPACRSLNWPIRRKLRARARSLRSATRIWPVRAKAGTALAFARIRRLLRRGFLNEFERSRSEVARQDTARLAAGGSAGDVGQRRPVGGAGNRTRDRRARPKTRQQTGFRIFPEDQYGALLRYSAAE